MSINENAFPPHIEGIITAIRVNIDAIDAQIISLLADRQHNVQNIGALKKTHDVPICQKEREQYMFDNIEAQAKASQLDTAFIKSVFKTIVKHSRKIQK